tara:strand:- start:161 stop:355 length:195 start_codon:yes stop_codon:yes gene_type:complete
MVASTLGDIVAACCCSESGSGKVLALENSGIPLCLCGQTGYGLMLDNVIETKAKEMAIVKYRKD